MRPKFPKLKFKRASSSLQKPSMNHMEPTNDIDNEMKPKQACLATPYCKFEQNKWRFSSLCYSKDKADQKHVHTGKSRIKKFSGVYHNAICHITLFLPGDEPTKSDQKIYSDQGNVKTINFTGVVHNITKPSDNQNKSKNNSGKNIIVSTVSSVFQPIYHITGSNQTYMVSDSVHEDLNLCFSNDDCRITNNEVDLDQAEWYDTVDVNFIGLVGYYEPLSRNVEVYNEVEVYDIPDDTTV